MKKILLLLGALLIVTTHTPLFARHLTFIHQDAAYTIPKAVKANPQGSPVSAPIRESYALQDINALDSHDVFPAPPCLEGT